MGVTIRRSEGREGEVVCLFMYNCLCLAVAVFLTARGTSNKHTETHAPAPQPGASLIHYSRSGSLQSAPLVTRRFFFQHSWLPPRWQVGSQAWPTG